MTCDAGNTKSVCSGTTYRGGMGKEVGGEFRREGTYVYPMPILVNVCKTIPVL